MSDSIVEEIIDLVTGNEKSWRWKVEEMEKQNRELNELIDALRADMYEMQRKLEEYGL